MSARREALAVALSAVAVGALYAALLAAMPLDSLWAGDQGAKLVQVVSLIRARLGSLAIPDLSLAYAPDARFSALPALYTVEAGEARVSIFSYPYALLTAPPFFALGYAGLYVVPLLATVATLVTAAALGAHVGLRKLWAVPPALGLATPLGFYALVFWEHALAALLATAALLCAAVALGEDGAPRPGRRGWAWAGAGLLAGLAWWFRAEALWLGPALLAGLAWAGAGRRGLAWAGAGLAAGLAPMLLFNLIVYGQPLGGQVAANFGAPGAAAALLPARLRVAGELLVGLSAVWGLWLAAWACAAALAAAPPRLRPWALAALAALAAAAALMTQPRDLNWTGAANAATLTLLAPLGLRLRAARPAARLLGGAALAYAAGVLLTAPNGGGAQFGPRYLLPVLPAAGLLALAAAQELAAPGAPRRALAAGALAALLAACLTTQARGLDLLRLNYGLNQRLVRVVNARPAPLVVSDAKYGPQLVAPLYFERPLLFVGVSEAWPELAALLRGRGETAFTYLTDLPRGAAPAALSPLAISCELVEGVAHGLSVFDCALAPPPGP